MKSKALIKFCGMTQFGFGRPSDGSRVGSIVGALEGLGVAVMCELHWETQFHVVRLTLRKTFIFQTYWEDLSSIARKRVLQK